MQARAILLSRSAFNKQALPSHSPHRYAPTLSAPSNLGRGCYDLVANVTALEDVASTPELEIAAEKPRTATPTSNCVSPYSGTITHGDSWGARIMVKHNENGKAKQVPMLGHLKRFNSPARSKLGGVSGSVGTPVAARHFVMVQLANIGGLNSVGKWFQARLPSIQRSDIIKRYYATKGKRRKEQVSTEEAMFDEKHAALEDALAQISSTFGKGTVMWLGRNVAPRNVPVISTGSLSLDAALGVGGLPKGRVVEIYGPEASGKTTLALHVIAEAQKTGGYCVFIDAEHALDPSFAEALGVRTENLLLAQPDCGEQALSLTDTFIRSGSIDVIVVDSVAALVPRAELDGEMGDAHMAVQARLMSQALRKLAHSLAKAQTILIFINQIRAKLASGGYGVLEVTSGGNALKFYASVRLNIRRTGFIKKGEETLGSSVSVKVAKNKVAPPFKTAEFEIEFGKGISKEGEIADFAIKFGLIGKSGNWYSYNGQHIANGKENLKTYLRGHTDLRDILLMKIRQNLISGQDDDMSEQELDLLERQDDVDVVVEEEEKVEAVVTS